MVKLAVERDDQLKARVEAGPAANIERIDNQQNIALRNSVLVQAQRLFWVGCCMFNALRQWISILV